MMSIASCSRFASHSPSGIGGVEKIPLYRALLAGALSLCLIAFLASSAVAQQSTGEIVGTVMDSSGAAVQGATVTAKDVERGTVLTVKTNETGAFDFPVVPVGRYQVRAEKQGFAAAAQPVFSLVLNQTARFNFQLKVGQITETVEVTGAAPVLQTETTLVGSILDSVVAQNLPLSTHNTNQLTLVSSPGVVTPNLFGFQAAQNTFGTGRPYVNGAREQENNFILDGMDNNQPDNNDVGFVPSPEAIQEFNLITGSAPADFGNYLGGVVNVVTKSGTNKFHGSAYEYLRRGGLNANSWTNNLNHLPRPGQHYDDFGGTVGGPIIKDKLFFFADYQESRFSQPATSLPVQTLSTTERSGDFGEICARNVPKDPNSNTTATAAFNGSGICKFTGTFPGGPAIGSTNLAGQLFDPASSANPATRTAFAFNRIAVGRLNSAAGKIINSSFYPATQFATNVQKFTTNGQQGEIKVDLVPSDKDHFMGRWAQQAVSAPTTNSIKLLGDADKTFPLRSLVLDETHTFTSSLLNDARVGFQYFPVTEGFSNPAGQNLPSTFGIAGATTTFLPAIVFNLSPLTTIGNNDLVQSFHDTTLQFEDTLTWTHGRHVIHSGLQAFHYIMNDLYPGNAGLAGQFTFNGQFTGNTGTTGGDPGADFFLGLPEDVQQGNGGGGNKYLRNSLYGGFAADTWHVRDNLTLNLGLRYELITARLTKNDQDVNFNLITGSPVVGSGFAQTPSYLTYHGIDNFQPRVGLAWQPKWGFARDSVVRAAYGISGFMEANGVNNLPYQNPPFIQAHEVTFSNQALPNTTLDQGFSNFPAAACTVALLQALSPICLSGATLHLTNPLLRPALDQQWNLSIQHQIGSRTSLQIGYVGNKIDHMSDIFIFNQKLLVSPGVVAPGPFAQPLINCCGAGNSPTIRFNDSSGIQRYNALQVTVEQREWKGVQFRANYTWSKCMNNSLGYFGPFGDEEALPGTTSQTGFSFFFQNAYQGRGDYGRCIADVASLFNGYLVYDLPFGKGKMFGGSVGDVANTIIGGWSLGSDFTLHSGFAITALGPDSSGTGSASPRANCPAGVSQSGNGKIVDVGGGELGLQFWNPAAAVPGTPGTFGTCGIGTFRGPGLATADLNLAKHFALTERINLQAMAQFINVTNTPILGRPSFFQGSTFGTITASNPGRQIQFGFKMNF